MEPRLDDKMTPCEAVAIRLDAADPLRRFKERFNLPEGLIYLDGNSLGALPRIVQARLEETIVTQWGRDLVTSWNKAGWFELPIKVGDKIAPLIGAPAGSVAATDSTSVNLFKALAAALALRPERRVIISERDNFPTDLYMAEGLSDLIGRGHELVLVDSTGDIPGHLDGNTAVLMLTHVNYRTGAVHDMAELTRKAHDIGALTIWDLCHSAGALPVAVSDAQVDFAVGCGYKYLNGGPGAPAFVYVAPTHQDAAHQPLSGWFSHRRPFAFEPGFQPARGIARFLCGTPAILSLAALDSALDLWSGIDMNQVRDKSVQLTDFFISSVETLCSHKDLRLVSPRESRRRGSQVSFSMAKGAPEVMQALIARGIVGDFRAPDIIRFGFAPLYVGFADTWSAALQLADIVTTGSWDQPQFRTRAAVT